MELVFLSSIISDELNFKAIKIQKSAQHYREAAHDEITLLSQIRDGDRMLSVLLFFNIFSSITFQQQIPSAAAG